MFTRVESMRSIQVTLEFTAVDTDVLNDTELETAPGDGVYIIRGASTVATATLQVVPEEGPPVSRARVLQLRANAEIRSEDPPWIVEVSDAERVTMGLGGTTGTARLSILYVGS